MATTKQIEMLKAIAHSLYTSRNGDEPRNIQETETWVFDICETPEEKGVLGSLTRDNFVEVYEAEPNECAVIMTEKGWEVYQANK